MPIPQNAQSIYQFLTGHGYTPNAAAGIVGNVEQESGGNPAEQGGGLIQILPGNPGYTSNPSLAAQEQSILAYNNAQGSSLIAQLNAQTSAANAALFYSNQFERPNAALANNANRQASATAVAQAAATGNWSAGSGASSGMPAQTMSFNPLSIGSALGQDIVMAPFKKLWNWILDSLGVKSLTDLLERGALIIFGSLLIIFGARSIIENSETGQKVKKEANSAAKDAAIAEVAA